MDLVRLTLLRSESNANRTGLSLPLFARESSRCFETLSCTTRDLPLSVLLSFERKVVMFDKAKHFIYSSPYIKTAFSILSSILIGLFSNTLVTDMSSPAGIQWGSFYRSVSFYLLTLFAVLTFLFHKFLYNFETDIQKFRDADFCLAYARSQLLPEQIEKYRQQIRAGDMEDFKAAMRQIQQVLK